MGRTRVVMAVLLVSLFACGPGRPGVVEDDAGPPPPTCTCDGRQCGDDGCGGSCGSCYDSNSCTDDSCGADGRCQNVAVPDSQTCEGLQLEGCRGGTRLDEDCRDVCEGAGYNFAGGCGLPGATPAICNCSTYTEQTCTTSTSFCTDSMTHGGCDAENNTWYVVDCEGYCRGYGYDGAIECSDLFGCVCHGTITFSGGDTYACLGYGGNCDGGAFCCEGWSCRWHYNGGNPISFCDIPSEPNPACDSCLASCRGLPSCCTGEGCICDSEC